MTQKTDLSREEITQERQTFSREEMTQKRQTFSKEEMTQETDLLEGRNDAKDRPSQGKK